MGIPELEDKQEWCSLGELQEHEFVRRYGLKLKVMLHPDKKSDPYGPDLIHHCGWLAELKTRNTPFFMAGQKYGLDPQTAVTINRKDIERYADKYKDLLLYFAVSWDAEERFGVKVDELSGIWGIRFSNLFDLCLDAPLHAYQNRTNDNQGNAKDSYVVCLTKMEKLL